MGLTANERKCVVMVQSLIGPEVLRVLVLVNSEEGCGVCEPAAVAVFKRSHGRGRPLKHWYRLIE